VTSRTWYRTALAGASFSLMVAAAHATPQVVGDEACARHEVDIASFASCVDGRVVPPVADGTAEDAAAAAGGQRARAGHFGVDARLGLPWLLVMQVLAVERAGVPQDAPTGCDSGPAGPAATLAQLR
jgi:hypothetical protein